MDERLASVADSEATMLERAVTGVQLRVVLSDMVRDRNECGMLVCTTRVESTISWQPHASH